MPNWPPSELQDYRRRKQSCLSVPREEEIAAIVEEIQREEDAQYDTYE